MRNNSIYAGEIDVEDFNTSSPARNTIDKYDEAMKFNRRLASLAKKEGKSNEQL